jgi:hypothetical protein
MIFEGADGTFGGVATTSICKPGGKLIVDFSLVRNEGHGAFVVEALEVRMEAGVDKVCMYDFERAYDASAGAIEHRFHEDTRAVIIVDGKNVIVAGAESDNESAHLIGMNLAGGWFKRGTLLAMVRAVVGGIAWGKVGTALFVNVVMGRAGG